MNRILSPEKTESLLKIVRDAGYLTGYDPGKHRIRVSDALHNELFMVRLPITYSGQDAPEEETESPFPYVIVLIRSGSCATGLYRGEKNIDHKVISAYMVRKKQGKSQIKYLKTRGKSRAGSRVRLADTRRFFEDINKRLQIYFEKYRIKRIAFSCSEILIPYLFNSKVPCPFNKKDKRIISIPRHIYTPNFGELTRVRNYLAKTEIIWKEESEAITGKLLGGL